MAENDSEQDLQPASFEQAEDELEQNDEYSQYMLHSEAEIVVLLRSLIPKKVLITVYFDRGESFFLTSMISVNPEEKTFVIDVSNSHTMNERALAADRLIFTAVVDKVKIRFSLDKLTAVVKGGLPAFQCALPDRLLRLQRREFFRLSTPIANPVRLHATVKHTENGPQAIDTPLVDISGGGIGLMIAPEKARFLHKDDLLDDCQITLPGEGLLTVVLCIRNMFDVAARNGMRCIRVGCEYVNLPDTRLTVIQRYITRIERERKARLNGLA